MPIPEIFPDALKIELDGPNPPLILDVREADELEISALPNAIHIPMNELPERLSELDPQANIVVICRVGGRSRNVTAFLLGHGFAQVRNLATGINGWADTVDQTLPKY